LSIPCFTKIYAGVEIIISIPFAKRQVCMKRKAIVMWVKKEQFGIKFIKKISDSIFLSLAFHI